MKTELRVSKLESTRFGTLKVSVGKTDVFVTTTLSRRLRHNVAVC